jgi:hypothetical protein
MTQKRTAVLYTGQVRTIEKCAPYFRKNILDPTGADVFAVIQGPILCETMDRLVADVWKDNLKTFDWFYRDAQYGRLQDELLSRMDIEPHWKHYLKTSGSMVEYYQLYLAFQKMKEYEQRNGFQYTHVIRMRTDVIITRPIAFFSDTFEQDDFDQEENMANDTIVSSAFSYERCQTRTEADDFHVLANNAALKEFMDCPRNRTVERKKLLINCFESDSCLFTIRKNLFYFGSRKVFEVISQLGTTYGQRRWHLRENWFDAESQLETICLENGIGIVDSTTVLEEKSLYHYRSYDYFDTNGQLLDNPAVFCFICRS